MANYRDKRRRSTTAHLWANEKETLERVAKENGLSQSEVIQFLIGEIKEREQQINEDIKKWKKDK